MSGNFLGDTVEQITAAGFLKAKLGSLNCFPPPHKPLFQVEFDANAAELVLMIKDKVPEVAAAAAAHGAPTTARPQQPAPTSE